MACPCLPSKASQGTLSPYAEAEYSKGSRRGHFPSTFHVAGSQPFPTHSFKPTVSQKVSHVLYLLYGLPKVMSIQVEEPGFKNQVCLIVEACFTLVQSPNDVSEKGGGCLLVRWGLRPLIILGYLFKLQIGCSQPFA